MKYRIIQLKGSCGLNKPSTLTCSSCSVINGITEENIITIFDFSGIEIVCSTMLSKLLTRYKHVYVCNCSENLTEVIKILKFDSVVKTFKTVEDAIIFANKN